MRFLKIMAGAVLLTLLHTAPLCFGETQEEVEEIVVTATRLETPVAHVGSSVTVISGAELEESGKQFLHEAIRAVPGLDVVRRGGPGQQTSVFMRGANSEHTLVLIDGVEANDAISPNRAFDFANVTTENIERVEIIRGPQSTLYGSDAIGGVINIITKKGKGKPSVTSSIEYGSFETTRVTGNISGDLETVNFALSLARLDTGGISAASAKDGNSERDGYENITLSSRIGVTPRENLDVEFIVRYIEADAELDAFDGDDPNSFQETQQLFLRGQMKVPLMGNTWENVVGFELSTTDRKNRDEFDSIRPADRSRSSFQGETLRGNWQGNVHFFHGNVLTFGVEVQEERGESEFFSESVFGPFDSIFDEKAARTEGYFIHNRMSFRDTLFVTAGARVDNHSRFGSELTYRVGASYLPGKGGTRLKGTFGTGFKAPSIFQLFDPASGNQDLEPEKSEGFDLGIEQELAGGKIKGGITYFRNQIRNLIEFTIVNPVTFEGELNNIGKSRSEGIEIFSNVSIIEPFTLSVNYTYNEAKDESSDDLLLRRARNRVNVSLRYELPGRGEVAAAVTYTGKRRDIFTDPGTFITERITIGGYTIVGVSATYRLRDDLSVFSRVDNLLDREYEEAKGFGTPGISAYVGLRAAI
jgi:vitamin B12 transporter